MRPIVAVVLLLCLFCLTACGDNSTNVSTGAYTISGTITHGGSALSGVTVTLSGNATGSTTTDAGGNYNFTVTNGSYTITPSLTSYTFTPASTSVTISNANSAANNFTSTTTTQTQLLINNSFESGLTGWTTDTNLQTGATGICSFNGVTAPGTETLTSLAGFPATDGTQTALGSVSSTTAGAPITSCVLYQDVAIPAGATTATFSFDIGVKGNINGFNNGYKVGIFSTASVPGYNSSPLVSTVYANLSTADTTPQSKTSSSVNISSLAGQTVRFAIINAVQNNMGEMIGIDNVKLTATVVQ